MNPRLVDADVQSANGAKEVVNYAPWSAQKH